MSELILPGSFKPIRRNAKMRVKVIFYRWPKQNNRITVGAPDVYPAPAGAEKIVCNSARTVEIWSERMREQDKREAEMTDYQREMIEGPMRAYARQELQHLLANARNAVNADFCRQALKNLDEREAHGKWVRDSYMHVEAFEVGH